MEAFALEFVGMAMVALCLVVLAMPAARRPSKRVRHD
jgi:Na+-transporting methylmalonyl-CoA/oxaloacetate decarboxylase gamma subunit